jgi:hypothetical protein
MNHLSSTGNLRQKFGEISFEIIFQKDNNRMSCVRQVANGAILACSIVTFYNNYSDKDFHKKILTGAPIGETLEKLDTGYERKVTAPFFAKLEPKMLDLFKTNIKTCAARMVDYKIEESAYVSIIEFYNPEFVSLDFLIEGT